MQQLSESIGLMAEVLAKRADYIRTFARSVSHEFKTPLTSIRGSVELMQDYPEMTAKERAQFLENLDEDAQRLEQLVGRLLELARADVERPTGGKVEVARVLREMAEEYSEPGFEVRVEGAPDVGEALITEEALRAVVANLLMNAKQHGEGPAAILAWGDGDRVVIEVWDQGPGISAGNRGKVFEDFFTTAREKGGTGLGLSITRTLLAAHGGSIELVESGEGARFRVILGGGE